MNLVNKAMEIAFRAHHGVTNNHDGEPYILHVHRVALACSQASFLHQATAWLHDAYEDNKDVWPLNRIEQELITVDSQYEVSFVVNAIDAISKRNGETLEEYYHRVKRNDIATVVKLADIRDNFRRNHLIDDEETRLRMGLKYSLGLDILS